MTRCFRASAWPPSTYLKALGVSVDFPAGQTCCGQPAFNSGYHDSARRSARAFLRAFAGSEHVVSISGSCAAMVRQHYPLLFAGQPEEADAASAGRAHLRVLAVPRATCCGWTICRSRGSGKADPASLLPHASHARSASSSPSACWAWWTVSSTCHCPALADCCGFGGTFAVKMPAISAAMVDEKVDHVLATGAELLMGLDMSCLMNIEGRLRRRGARRRGEASRRGAAREGWQR